MFNEKVLAEFFEVIWENKESKNKYYQVDSVVRSSNFLKELEDLKKISPSQMYSRDLDTLLTELDKVEKQEEDDMKHSKKKVTSKKDFSRKADMATAPSPMGQRVVPVLDDMIKKAEAATKTKENKGQTKRAPKKKEVKEEEMEIDEYDLMAGENDSLLAKLNSSTESEKDVGTKVADKKKAPRKPKATTGEPRKKKAAVDGMKQTKLTFNPPKTKAKDSKGKSKKSFDSDSSDILLSSDDDDYSFTKAGRSPSPVRPRTQRAAASKKTYVLSDSEDNDEKGFESDE